MSAEGIESQALKALLDAAGEEVLPASKLAERAFAALEEPSRFGRWKIADASVSFGRDLVRSWVEESGLDPSEATRVLDKISLKVPKAMERRVTMWDFPDGSSLVRILCPQWKVVEPFLDRMRESYDRKVEAGLRERGIDPAGRRAPRPPARSLDERVTFIAWSPAERDRAGASLLGSMWVSPEGDAWRCGSSATLVPGTAKVPPSYFRKVLDQRRMRSSGFGGKAGWAGEDWTPEE